MATKIESLKKILEGIYALYNNLCNVDFFIQENQQTINRLQGELKATRTTLSTIPSNSQVHFQRLLMTHGRLFKLQAKEANMRTRLLIIQYMLFPHIEVMKLELSIVKGLMRRDTNISTEEGFVELVATLEIQIHTLEVARHN